MKLTDVFRPKADAAALREFNQIAWTARSEALSERLKIEAGEILAAHLESLYPPEDMRVLTKYGCAQTRNVAEMRVRVPSSDRWSEQIGVPLARAVIVPSSYNGLYCGGPRFSKRPGNGVNQEIAEEIKAGRHHTFKSWDAFLEDQQRRERERIPEVLEPLIFELVSTRLEYKADYNEISQWPKEYRTKHGVYPTWAEIAKRFPVAGAYIFQAAAMPRICEGCGKPETLTHDAHGNTFTDFGKHSRRHMECLYKTETAASAAH